MSETETPAAEGFDALKALSSAPQEEADLLGDRQHAGVETPQGPHPLAGDRERHDRAQQQRVGRVVALLDQIEEGHDVHHAIVAFT